ncbi:caveolae-associated protein 2b [Pangasianodon hypophthalmus]|uniref:caveolae-associated protein 2b n=1 Tax=Pangasianodon hypophthalmus TaxID=310915 RepID=UPI0023071DD0|nr:caveolae-associated protein 2b [Pangasianodon hypophthalmus]
MGEDEVQVEKSNMEMEHESQELLVPSDPQPSHSDPSHSDPSHSDPSHPLQLDETHEVNAITVLTLLDQLVKMLDSVQEKQQQMEEWQHAMEGSVRHIQNDMNKLVKSNSMTTNSVSKLLEKNRKISAIMKDVREKMERQTVQVKKLEDNHNYLLHRDNFRVLIFQDENEIPSSVFVKDSIHGAENESLSPDANRSQEEVELHTVQLSSDEDLDEEQEDEEEFVEVLEPLEKSRTEKIKRSSLKKVDSLKKAFSRENFEKKMNKIVSAEKREKIKKSLSQKNKSGSFKIFHIKKTREGGKEHAEHETFTEIHADLAPAQEEDAEHEELAKEKMGGAKEKEEVEEVEKEEVEVEKEDMEKEEMGMEEVEKEEVALDDDDDDAENELSITEGLRAEYTLSATLPQETSHISHNALHGEEEEEEEEQREREEGDEGEEESTAAEKSS